MNYQFDFSKATSEAVEQALCWRLDAIRLSRNITQQELADAAGLSLSTMRRLLRGRGVSFDSFLRVLLALDLGGELQALLPDPDDSPLHNFARELKHRRRAYRTHRDRAAGEALSVQEPAPDRWPWEEGA